MALFGALSDKRYHKQHADASEANFNPIRIFANLDQTVIYKKAKVKST